MGLPLRVPPRLPVGHMDMDLLLLALFGIFSLDCCFHRVDSFGFRLLDLGFEGNVGGVSGLLERATALTLPSC